MKLIQIEYEIPPLRAIYFCETYDVGQTDEQIRKQFAEHEEYKRGRIRKISRVQRDPNVEFDRQFLGTFPKSEGES